MDSLSELGRRITHSTDDHRESAFLFQRLSVSIQRYNSGRFVKKVTMGTLARQAEIGVWFQAPGRLRRSGAITPEKNLRLYMQNPAI